MENFATDTIPGQVKFSMKGVNKGQFKNPMSHYEHVLTSMETLEPVTLEFIPRTRRWLHTNSMAYFYPKRKVLDDGCSPVPLDI